MASAADQPATSTVADPRALRRAQLLRAAVLLASGIAITFTATMHEQLRFDIWLLLVSLTLIGVATLIEYRALRYTDESWWVAARAVVAFGGAGTMLVVADSRSMALQLSIWAILTAVITALRLLRGVQPKSVAIPSLLLSVGLAVAVLIFSDDPVAVTGFFGTYAVIRGVFLGISAFDLGGARESAAHPDAAPPQAAQPATVQARDNDEN